MVETGFAPRCSLAGRPCGDGGWPIGCVTPRFASLLQPPPPHEWVALDCETTGLDVRTDEIVSIGAVRIEGDRIVTSERLELLVRPERAVSANSVRIHRLRTQDLAEGLPLSVAVEQLLHFYR